MISRRAFLRDTGLTLAACGIAARRVPRRLIVVLQRGAADGLSMVVPYTDPAYYRLRPSIAVPPPGHRGAAIDLDGRFAFHPRLAPLLPLYRAGQLAVVHTDGLPVRTQSHLEAQAAVGDLMGHVKRDASAAGCRVSVVECGQWDDHADQGGVEGRLASRLDAFATTLAGMVADVESGWHDTVIVTMTEFGRSATENQRGGTEHGHGSVMLVLGGSVAGGQVVERRYFGDVFSEFAPWLS